MARKAAHSMLRPLLWTCLAAVVVQPGSSVAAPSGPMMDEREVLLESGVPASPHAIIPSPDGGYVIVGEIAEAAWATRVDPNLRVVWRHKLDHPSFVPAEGASEYFGAVILPDNSVLLCGYLDAGRLKTPNPVGLLTRITSKGEVLSKRQVTPLNDDSFEIGYIRGCSATTDGIIAVGNATQVTGDGPHRALSNFLWVLGLTKDADIVWQKSLPNADGAAVEQISLLANSKLLVQVGGGFVLLERGGDVAGKLAVDNAILARSIAADSTVRIVSDFGTATVTELGDHLQEISRITGTSLGIIVRRAYRLADGTFALFGTKPDSSGSSYTAAIARLNGDLSSSNVVTLGPAYSSPQIEDAIPTGVPGEFATVRLVVPIKHLVGASETRLGLGLAFVRYPVPKAR